MTKVFLRPCCRYCRWYHFRWHTLSRWWHIDYQDRWEWERRPNGGERTVRVQGKWIASRLFLIFIKNRLIRNNNILFYFNPQYHYHLIGRMRFAAFDSAGFFASGTVSNAQRSICLYTASFTLISPTSRLKPSLGRWNLKLLQYPRPLWFP